MTRHHVNEVGQHQTGESEEVIASQRRVQAFVVAGQATEAGGPGKIALNDPAARLYHTKSASRVPLLVGAGWPKAGVRSRLAPYTNLLSGFRITHRCRVIHRL